MASDKTSPDPAPAAAPTPAAAVATGPAAPQVTIAPPTIIDDPIECCYFDHIAGNVGSIRMVRAVHLSTAPEETGNADILVYFEDRRITKKNVPYGPGKPGSWGWPNDK